MLAAGAGRRFGPAGDKLLAEWRGRPVLEHVLATVAEARDTGLLSGALVVRAPHSVAIEAICRRAGIDSVVAHQADTGIGASLREGFAALERHPAAATATAALVLLGDQPTASLNAIRAVVRRGGASRDALVRARYAASDAPGHPALVGRDHWGVAKELQGDRGFDPALRTRGLAWSEVTIPGDNPDIDTPDDLSRLHGA